MKTHQISMCARGWLTVVLLAGTSAAAYAQKDIKVYRVPKEQPPMAAGKAAAGLVPVSESALPRLTWKTPAGWTELPPGQMRVASFKVQAGNKLADVSVIPLPGAAGGDLPNVNRWRGQVGLGPVSEAELTKAATKLEIAGLPALLHDMAGTNTSSGDATRILGAIQHRDGMAWFFKMTGDDELVGKNRPAFLEWLKSVKFEAPVPGELPANHPPLETTQLPAGHPEFSPATGKAPVPGPLPADHPPIEPAKLPAGHPEITPATAGNAPSPEVSSAGKLRWTVPAGWKEIPGGQFLYAKFTLTGEAGAVAAVNVSTSAGDGGGLAANVNRWRGQLGQAAWSEAELQKQVKPVEVDGKKILFVEMTGADARSGQPATVVGAMVTHGDATWFYKLMGDAKLVAAQQAAFTQFVKGVKY